MKLLGFGGGARMVCGDVRGSCEKWIEKSVTLCCVVVFSGGGSDGVGVGGIVVLVVCTKMYCRCR